jgi:hypothetical protein
VECRRSRAVPSNGEFSRISLERVVLVGVATGPAGRCLSRATEQLSHRLTPELPPIGTTLVYLGRVYRFCGVTPASIQPVAALLQDLQTGEWTQVPVAQLLTRPK